MKRFATIVLSLLLVAPVVALGQAEDIEDLQRQIDNLEQRLDESQTDQSSPLPEFENSSVTWFGRVQNDWTFVDTDDDVTASDQQATTIDFRRVRLGASGSIDGWMNFKTQIDFADDTGNVSLKDVYLNFKHLLGPAELRVGHFFEPVGMERQASTKHIIFMETGAQDYIGRSLGASVHGTSQNFGYELGYFKQLDLGAANQTGNVGSANDNAWALTGRLHGQLLNTADQVAHLGVSYRFENHDSRSLGGNYLKHPAVDSTNAPGSGTNANFNNGDLQTAGIEAAYQAGSVLAQAEYLQFENDPQGPSNENSFSTWYASLSSVLTGESRRYSLKDGTFQEITPAEHFHPVENPTGGALEAALRVAQTDVSEVTMNDYETSSATAGLSFYPNDNSRWQLNYTYAEEDHTGSEGAVNTVATRFQFYF